MKGKDKQQQQCLHCPKVLSGKNPTRLKLHLLNLSGCAGFLKSTDAAMLASAESDVRAALAALPKGVPGARAATSLPPACSSESAANSKAFQEPQHMHMCIKYMECMKCMKYSSTWSA